MTKPEKDTSLPLFAFELTLQARDFQTEWKRCNMLANYIAEYVAYQFAQQERAENLVSTITNELLETVTRLAPAYSDLFIRCTQFEDELELDAKHIIRDEVASPYLAFLENLGNGASDGLYLELLTAEMRPTEYFNQLGLTMLTHDFGAHLTASLDKSTDRIWTRISISTEEFSV
jgi:hypothetical protein